MNLKLTRLIVPVLLLLFAETLHAQSGKENIITTAVPFLRLATDARAGGMGDVGVATDPDANAMFYNGAKTIFNDGKYGAGLTYTPWLSEFDIKSLFQASVAGFYKLDDKQSVSLGFRNFSQGTFTFYDVLGQETSTFKPNDMAIEAGYSRKLSKKSAIGLNVRYIRSRLADNTVNSSYKTGSAFAADLSYFCTKKEWNFGVALTNLGTKMNYGGEDAYLPANLALGAAWNKKINNDNKISFAFDLNKLLVPTPPDPTNAQKVADYNNKGVVGSWFSSFGDAPGGGSEELKEIQLGLGAEYTYKEMFSLRAGYFTENKLKGNRNYLTVGAGLQYKIAGINFSYLAPTGNNANNNALKNTFRLSLLFDMNKTTASK
ncbi:MAG: type IX secretion system outer membrane channel protein PorV [Ferruginibacter sp.]|nr:type IX secretion system outer membrane channel protein PorV [Ferruginibacter sp.]